MVDFDPTATGNALRAAGLPSWGANRPAVLAWWLNESADGSSLVGDNQARPNCSSVRRRTAACRCACLWRISTNRSSVPRKTSPPPNPMPCAQPSERYAADALLAVDAKEADGKWQAQWRLWMGDSREQGQAEGATPDALADSVMLAVGNRLSTRFVATPEAATGLTLQVQGATLARYAELQRLLDPFGARLVGVRGDRLDYSVKASPEQLRAQLGLAQLQEIPADSVPLDASGQPAAPSAAVPSSTQLNFRWQ